MESRFKDRGLGAIKVDERGGAEAGAAGGVGCFDVGNFCEGACSRLRHPSASCALKGLQVQKYCPIFFIENKCS